MFSVRDCLFLVVLFVANVIQGITGFAGTVLAMPFSLLLIGADDAKTVLAVMALVSCAAISACSWRSIVWRELIRIVAIMAVGMAAGIVIYALAPLDALRRVYGVVVVAIALGGLLSRRRRPLPRPALDAVLVAAGVIHGMFVSGGALLVVYATQTMPDKDRFRATVSAVWVPLNLLVLAQLVAAGAIGWRAAALSVAGLAPLALAVAVGGALAGRIDQRRFMRLTYVLLLASGLSIVW